MRKGGKTLRKKQNKTKHKNKDSFESKKLRTMSIDKFWKIYA